MAPNLNYRDFFGNEAITKHNSKTSIDLRSLHRQKRGPLSLYYRQNRQFHPLMYLSFRRLPRPQRSHVHRLYKATKQCRSYIRSSNMLSDSSVNWSSQHSQHIPSWSSLSCSLISFPHALHFPVFFSSVTSSLSNFF